MIVRGRQTRWNILQCFRQPEIAEQRLPLLRYKHIGLRNRCQSVRGQSTIQANRFDIPMDELLCVQVLYGAGNLSKLREVGFSVSRTQRTYQGDLQDQRVPQTNISEPTRTRIHSSARG